MSRSAAAHPPHDEDRCARLYVQCKGTCVAFARKLLADSGRNRHLSAFEAEEFYDVAWETYYDRREYLEDRDDHPARLNALIRDRILDERRRGKARRRTAPGRIVDIEQVELAADDDDRLVERDELRFLLAHVRSPADARALVDHAVRGLTFEEIGAREGITAEGARRRAHRAAEQARRLLHAGENHD